ncbi:MAG: SsrA-binding protein [Rhodospirillales bacterium RIFCSPLOWO2_12_FULL_58_28]|nr:MAG: SsrA-binding protein [Rhodospirillales bacterium RIFCSPLOWO2_02_FULL_58_16]OHC78992.1 MAG: SsrA-binding protein [Rhodospirillales bacterium RIFCSPLOWO2_12_FULL_58_28]
MARKKKTDGGKIAAQNRKARHDYFIEETFHAGIMLTGTEVKSLRQGRASIIESFAGEVKGELFLLNAHIPEYESANRFNHEPKRPRKLLLRKREIAKLIAGIRRKGMTLAPLSIYFNERGMAKVELALARGKHTYDKRASVKDRDWNRDKARLLRGKG